MGEATGISQGSPDLLDILGPSISGFSNTFQIAGSLPQFHCSFLLDHVPTELPVAEPDTLLWMLNLGSCT